MFAEYKDDGCDIFSNHSTIIGILDILDCIGTIGLDEIYFMNC